MTTTERTDRQDISHSPQYFWTKYFAEDHLELVAPHPLFPHLLQNTPILISEIVDSSDVEHMKEYFSELTVESPPTHCFLKKVDFHIRQATCTSLIKEDHILTVWNFSDDETSHLLAAAAHDLRSPINSLVGLTSVAQIILKSPEINRKELSQIIDMMEMSCQNALAFTSDLLELSEIESGTYQLKSEEINIHDFINQFIENNKVVPQNKDITIESKLDVPSKATFRINKSKINRVLTNLLSNAVKFSKSGQTIKISSHISDTGETEIHMEDSGVGMSKEILDNLFVKFGKSKRKGLAGEKSHGLGMSIVKQIMDMHGGNVFVYSQENKGTTVKLSFKN